ncbi:sigma-70 family RNA polymerase sigma factor [Paenibacillus dendritiformis]|uniref:sigma-70 family RNA polymerase sigma factor n=1 Tax=Paenibacillus dendritiformis TaxID=130049 RepID=UPI001059A6D1|nr:sigma-70 family RNA polymerase sigma factor [Paenibacillus dendritiformis]TDL48546.1 sigma-70 family RNA polymerase sigma factor [Paenibacillus dendritiformis]
MSTWAGTLGGASRYPAVTVYRTISVYVVLAGNLHAFEEIYKQTIDQVYRTLYFLTDNTRELDDLVQEIYVELFRSLSAFDPSRSFPAWLYGITIRQHQAHRRKRRKQQRNDATERLASSERTEPQ